MPSIHTQKTHTTAVVLIPPQDVWTPIQEIRSTHDRNFHRWMPHITMLYPFAERESFHAVMPTLAEAAAGVKPFAVQLARFSHFRQRRYCTLFLMPTPEGEIIQLHARLTQALPDFDDTGRYAGGFHPHLSVGQFQHQQIADAQARFQANWAPIAFTVAGVSLIYRAPETDDRFVVAETFPLVG